MNEWEFTGEVASTINEILTRERSLPFSRAKIEKVSSGSRKRQDLTLLDQNDQIALTGEIKLPFQKDGNSPYNFKVVRDAREKARQAGARFFFTWNVNEFVLWETSPAQAGGLYEENYKSWEVTSIHREEHFDVPPTFHAVSKFLAEFLDEFSRVWRGTSLIGTKSPDEKFIEALESSLKTPINQTLETLLELYQKAHFKRDMDQWMRDGQGWTIWDDEEGVRDNLTRAARFACYTLVTKLVFHEALFKRYGRQLDKLTVPEHVGTGEELRQYLLGGFERAIKVTGDYETVFGEDPRSKGSLIPFYCDRAVPHWRELIGQIHDFDFSRLDYEIIGNIFEKLISPEWRRRYGQFYTRVEVVDLINSFCIVRGDEKVLDPACGGGTFLVRAYARKKELQLNRKHGELLSDLFGVDLDLFAANLTTINLATRDLIDEENYPQVARGDFFDVFPEAAFLSLPRRLQAKGLGPAQRREVSIPPLDAVVGNPPYIRQEMISQTKTKGSSGYQSGTKQYYQDLVTKEAQADLSGRSDIHCYFWPHAWTFLKEDGYLCFLTSSQWLDVEYGFRLQEWVLKKFAIVAVIESVDEPWFIGARVATTVTILKRQSDETGRMSNIVRFIQLRRPLKELLVHDGTTADAMSAVERFRDEILGLQGSCANERYRARLISQRELWDQGVELGRVLEKSGDEEPPADKPKPRGYYGGKWGVYLRAPDLWFRLLDEYGDRFVPLGNLVEVRFGVKSGKDSFFFPKDASREQLENYPDDDEFRRTFGVSRIEVELGKVKLVWCGEGRGEIKPIESEYLESEVHSLMEVGGYTVRPEDCSRMILLINKKKRDLKKTYALKYISWGESKKYHLGVTCQARAGKARQWYDLTGHRRGELFWPMAQQYKHLIPVNDRGLICNHNLFDLFAPEEEVSLMAAVLNSSLMVLSKFNYGRPVGVEGNLKTEVIDVKMMLTPDVSKASVALRKKLARAFERMKNRPALFLLSERRLREMAYRAQGREHELEELSVLSELDLPDRRALDDAVLQLIGVKTKADREALLDELYDYLRGFFETTRQKEEKAIVNKNVSRRKGPARPADVAAQILDDIRENNRHLLLQYDPDFLDLSTPLDLYEVPEDAQAHRHSDMFTQNGVEFVKKKKKVGFLETRHPAQDDLVMLLIEYGLRGAIRVPRDADECLELTQKFQKHLRRREAHIRQLIEERTADEQTREKIHHALTAMLASGDEE